jgi:uncharacterized protein
MKATLRALLLAAVGALALSAAGLAQVSTDVSKAMEQANAAYGRADYAEALRWARVAAEQGNADAQYNLGLMYANGQGVQENHAEAVRWFRLAADQGDAMAQYKVGLSYRNGWGLPKDYVEAARWNRLAADQGDAVAQLLMGLIYQRGEGVPQNQTEATRWYRLAAEQGNADAQYGLGVMYAFGSGVEVSQSDAVHWFSLAAEQGNIDAQVDLGISLSVGKGAVEDDREAARWLRMAAEAGNPRGQVVFGNLHEFGEGVPQSFVEAASWYRLAAEQGYALAQSALGTSYFAGRGVPENYVEAYKWWNLAAGQGDETAIEKRDSLRRLNLLTADQLAEAQRLSTEFRPRSPSPASEPSLVPNHPQRGLAVESTGSGFFVTSTGHLLTNAHVVEGCSRVLLVDGTRMTVLDIDASSDLALLKAGATSTRAPLSLRQGRGVRLADNVVVAGFPLSGLLSSGLNVTTGAVSALAGPGDDRRLIQITAPVQPGNSGGPLLDASGNVVGVVVSKLDAVAVASVTGDIPQNVNFAISLGTLQAFLDSNSIDYQTRASSSPKSNADVAEMARAATVQIECRN